MIDNDFVLANRTLSPAEEFTVTGSKRNEKFTDKKVPLLVNGITNTIIGSSCTDLSIGSTYGNFTVIAAVTLGGSSVCCPSTTVASTAPIFTNVPANINIASSSSCGAVVTWTEPIATDNCFLKTFESTHQPGDFFPVGTTKVVYTATNDAGLSTSSFDVVVTDRTAPVFSGVTSQDIIVSADQLCSATVVWEEPQIDDECQVTLTKTHQPNDRFKLGTTRVEYQATDASGNISKFAFNVIVQDRSLPTFTAFPENIVINAYDECAQPASWNVPTATDACSAVTLTGSHTPGDKFTIGSTLVTYRAQDASGNEAIKSFTVTVVDFSIPMFTSFPTDMKFTLESECSKKIFWDVPVASDPCSTSIVVTASHKPGDEFFAGTTVVRYVAKDDHGNENMKEFQVILEDPKTLEFHDCPSNVVITTDEEEPMAINWLAPTTPILCEPTSITSSNTPGSLFNVGTTAVVYSAKTPSGKSAFCTFDVTILYEKKKLFVSKLITPDGDGENDEWLIANIEKFRNNKILIFDRWGSVIFEAKGYDNERVVWRGSNLSGAALPTGTYFYSLIASDGKERHQEAGSIELVR
jgi:large repetitive protein